MIHRDLHRRALGATRGDDQQGGWGRLRNSVIVVASAQFKVKLVVDFWQIDGFGELAILRLMRKLACADLGQVHKRFGGSRPLHCPHIERDGDSGEYSQEEHDEEYFEQREP